MISKNNYSEIDQKIIKGLLKKKEDGKLTDIDEIYLKKLIKKEINYDFLQKEKEKCKNDPIYFINKYIYVKNKISNPDKLPENLRKRIFGDKIKLVLYPIQEKLARAILEHDKVISVKSRQIGFTTTTGALSLHLIEFYNNKSVMIISKSEDAAKDTLKEIKFMYNSLPFFLRRKILVNREGRLELGSIGNSSSITSLTSGKNAGRSASATWLVIDEAEFIKNIEELYSAAYPTISATGGKIIILSTPYYYGSWFHRMVLAAEEGKNNFILIKGHQRDIPGRDDEWYKDQCEGLGQDKNAIKTELEMEWILPGDPYFDEDKVKQLPELKPIENIGVFEIYKPPEKDKKYLISIDPSEDGADYTVALVIDLSTKEITAGTRTKLDITSEVLSISKLYNGAKILVEKNRGYHIIMTLERLNEGKLLAPNIKENPRTGKVEIDENKKGLQTSSSNRGEYFIEISKQLNNSKGAPKQLKKELGEIIIKNGKPIGLNHDDAVMALGLGLYYIRLLENLDIKNISNKSIKKIIKYLQSNKNKSIEELNKILNSKNDGDDEGLNYIDEELKEKILKAAINNNLDIDLNLISYTSKILKKIIKYI